MAIVTRGFRSRRRDPDERVPPGQYVTEDFPVLSAGPTPRIDTDRWSFELVSEHGERVAWTWRELMALPIDKVETDIHCVTRWSKLATRWRGVSLDHVLGGVDTSALYAMVHSYGGYTTNVPLADLRGGKAWIAFEFDGRPLRPEHGGPARLLIPHLYFWKSAKWVSGLHLQVSDEPGFWERNGYSLYGDPWTEDRYS
jgi:DMSO/TMAO reductase YedYZ molybdopterin-dependent catalytic subunit